jgi:hypothetical protein
MLDACKACNNRSGCTEMCRSADDEQYAKQQKNKKSYSLTKESICNGSVQSSKEKSTHN